MMPNPAVEILNIRIALNLSDEQVTKLETLSDSLKARTLGLSDQATKEIQKAGANADPGAIFSAMRPLLDAVRTNNTWAVTEAKGILTEEQWRQVPDRIKTAPQGGQGQRRGPPPLA